MTIQATNVTPDSIVMIINGDTQVVTSESHSQYDKIRAAIRDKDFSKAEELVDLSTHYTKQFNVEGSRVKLEDGVITLDDEQIHGSLANRILCMADEGFDINPMCLFVENLDNNPSKRAVDQLFGFLEATDLPITEDGHFLAYKMVKLNYTDHHTGKMDNSVGAVVKMPRNRVNENPNDTCSEGLHFCSQEYLGNYCSNGRTVIVKVNPANVVSIPTDYNNSKGRACEYEIVGELNGDIDNSHTFDMSVADKATEQGEVRQFTSSGGQNILTRGSPKNDDLLYVKRAAEILGINGETVRRAISDGDVDVTDNTFGSILIVWDNDYYKESRSWGVMTDYLK